MDEPLKINWPKDRTYRWFAMDRDGTRNFFYRKPHKMSYAGVWIDFSSSALYIAPDGEIPYCNWEDSLVERKDV